MAKYEKDRKYESMTLSLADAAQIIRDEMDAARKIDDSDFQSIEKHLGKEKADALLEKLIEDNARRICLISIYGLDEFENAAMAIVKTMDPNLSPIDMVGCMKLVEEELAK